MVDSITQIRHREMLRLLQFIFVGYWILNFLGAVGLYLAGYLPLISTLIIGLFLISNFSITEVIKRLPTDQSLLLEKFRFWVLAPFISGLMVVFVNGPLAPFWFGFLTLAMGTGPMILRSPIPRIPHGVTYGIYLALFYTATRMLSGSLNGASEWGHHALQALSILLVSISYSLTVTKFGALLDTIAERERYASELQEIANVGDYRFDVRENNLHLSKVCSRILGCGNDASDAQLELLLNSVHPDDRSKFEDSFRQTIRLGSDSELQFRILDPAGNVRYVRCVRHASRSEETGQVIQIKGILQDMTDYHLMLASQRESDALLKAVVNELPIGIAYQDNAGSFKMRNSTYERLEPRLLQNSGVKIMRENFAAALQGSNSEVSLAFTAEDGDEGSAEVSFHPFRNIDGEVRGVIVAAFDVTSRKRMDELVERQRGIVINAARMSALGEMASGIAHEINNPLAIIAGKTQQLLRRIDGGEVDIVLFRQQLRVIESTGTRIATIIRGLRSFARDGQKDPFEKSSVKAMIDDTVALCQSRFANHDVQLEVLSPENDIAIDCRAVQITQVILNLLNNAYDAVKLLPEKWVRLSIQETPDEIVFVVTDSGSGIPALIRDKILTPFFTTKVAGEGTGLGLSIATGIAKDHNGKLEINGDSPNTCFWLTLPKTQIS